MCLCNFRLPDECFCYQCHKNRNDIYKLIENNPCRGITMQCLCSTTGLPEDIINELLCDLCEQQPIIRRGNRYFYDQNY